MSFEDKKFGFSTRAIHAGQNPAPENRAIMTPIFQSSTYVQTSPGVHQGYDYSRTANPTRTALEANLAALEGGKFGISFSSGCAAGDALLHTLKSGDHVLAVDDLYGGTFRLFERIFRQLGIDITYHDLTDLESVADQIKPQTKLVWIETPTNPLLKIIDIERIAELAHKRGAKVVVDNTFASPYLQNPLALGADYVLHSCTKYIGGHSDLIGGAVITNDQALGDELHYIQNSVGAVPAPFECFLLLRSTKTLAVRMERHCENAIFLAENLAKRSDIERVVYPGLKSHPQFELAKKQMRSGGGMLSIVLKGGLERTRTLLESLTLFSLAESLGGVESLVNHPSTMTHASIPKDRREGLGITDSLVRFSVGIEDRKDLLADLEQALERSARSN